VSGEPVASWDARVLVGSEATFGTVPNPAAAQAYEFIDIDTGAAELGEVRAKKDRNQGRGMSDGFIIGRVKPMPWSMGSSIKSRAAVDTVPQESALYKSGGLKETVTGGVNVIYSLSGNPQVAGDLDPVSIYRCLGIGTTLAGSSRYYAEQLRGCVSKQIQWSGGDRELLVKYSGDAIGKYHLGYSSSITFADGSGTTLTFGSAEEAYRFGIGWYQIESEIIKITVPAAVGGTTATVLRAQLASSGVAHAAKPLVPYLPSLTYPGNPISEVNASVVVDGQTIRFTSFVIDFTTGVEQGPGETGSAYIQTPIVKRYNLKVSLKGLMRREDVALIGKASRQATPLATSIVCGTGTGSIVTFSIPQCEVDAMKVPDAANDMAMWSLTLRTRDTTTGNDTMTITCT
jgi:hypothetical protein